MAKVALNVLITGRGEKMQAQKLLNLLLLIKKIDDRLLFEIASCPRNFLIDYEDHVIVSVAKGEREWRLECQD